MAEQHIRLSRSQWTFDPDRPLGAPGGFGIVFQGKGGDGGKVAVKQLRAEVYGEAHREIAIADELIGRELENVLEFLDSGFDEASERFFVVMPMAEADLSTHIQKKGLLTEADAVSVILQIAKGLKELPELVHRDLKPANVLLHEGTWKIADFGIARFVERATSARTLKGFLSYSFAAPEQWRLDRATHATDVYALGVIAFSMLAGRLPYEGPEAHDFREQHLSADIPRLESVSHRLSSLVTLMLNKSPEARPEISRVEEILLDISSSAGSPEPMGEGLQDLGRVGVAVAEAEAQRAVVVSRERSEMEERQLVADSAKQTLRELAESFESQVSSVAPAAKVSSGSAGLLVVELGSAQLVIDFLQGAAPIPAKAFERSGWDVVVGAYVTVAQVMPSEYQWSANLWFTDLGQDQQYRWWEVSYMSNALSRRRREFEPFSVTDLRDADAALGPVMHAIQSAADPRPIDGEDTADFIDRWSGVLATASRGQLRHPDRLPMSWDR